MVREFITNNVRTLRNTTTLVEEATVEIGEARRVRTIEMRVDAQAVGDVEWRKHYIIIDGEWDRVWYRNRRAAKRMFDDTVAYWRG